MMLKKRPRLGVLQNGTGDGYQNGFSFGDLSGIPHTQANSTFQVLVHAGLLGNTRADVVPLFCNLNGGATYQNYLTGFFGIGANTKAQFAEWVAQVGGGGTMTLTPELTSLVHLTFTRSDASDNYNVDCYVNGIRMPRQTRVTAGGSTANAWAFGRYYNSAYISPPFLFSDIRVWNRVLTPQEVRANWNTVLTGKEPNLIRYYRCDERSGLTLVDSSSTQAHVTLSGGVRVPLRPYEPLKSKSLLTLPSVSRL